MKTLTRREILGGLALALAAAATSNASADTAKEPISLNEKTLEGISDPDGPVYEPDPSMEILREQERFQYEYFLEHMGPHIKTVALGETYPLANIEEGLQPYVYWNGAMETTVLAAALYPNMEEAQKAYDLGSIYEPARNVGEDARGSTGIFEFLVIQIQVTNIDALSFDGTYYFTVDNTFRPKCVEEMHDGTGYEYLNSTFASFDSATQDVIPGHSSENRFELLPGETKVLTTGYWVCLSYTKAGVTYRTKNPANIVLRPELAANPTAYGPIRFDLGLPDYLESDEEPE